MTIWIDAHLSPAIALWIRTHFPVHTQALRDLNLRDAEDAEIFEAAKKADVVVMTKDQDFIKLLERFGAPPKIIWITCGNTSNAKLKEIFQNALPAAISLLEAGEDLVEISDKWQQS